MKSPKVTRVSELASYVLAVIFVLMPFHALLTVFASTLVGHYDLLRLWKEIILVLLTPVATWVVWKSPNLQKRLREGWLFWAIAAYVVLHVMLGLVALAKGQVNSYSLLYAWVINLRPMFVFVLAYIFASQSDWLKDRWKQLLLIPATAVVAFGLLQATILPHDFLSSFGYNVSTIEPFQTVDSQQDYVRVQSTLRGSNPLGAYLVLALTGFLVLMQRNRSRRNLTLILATVAGFGVLFATYSRSAYIGMIISTLALVLLTVKQPHLRKRLWLGLAALAVLMSGIFVILRNNDRFENTFFHTSEQSVSDESSNEQRASALNSGMRDVVNEPFGRGPGTAGPASVHNVRPARVAENYYLQISQEVGWLGLGLFVAIVAMVGGQLWRLRHELLARTLLVALIGISVIGLVQHVWADDTLAIIWWGMAGVCLAQLVGSAAKTKTASGKMKRVLHKAK
jgi:O-antigen ligase